MEPLETTFLNTGPGAAPPNTDPSNTDPSNAASSDPAPSSLATSGLEPLDVEHAGRTLRGMLHVPEEGPAPLVVLCHGFSGNRSEFGNVFPRVARELAAQGIAAYRFDFAGHGESDGDFADVTVSDQVGQAAAVLDRLSAHPAVDPKRVSLLGMSLGGLTAVLLAGRREIRSLALWAPAAVAAAVTDREDDWRWREIQRQGYADLGGSPIHEPFIADAEGIEPWEGGRGHAGPVVIVGGTEDALVAPEHLDRYRAVYGDRLELHLIEGADHGFGSVPARKRLIDVTMAFLLRHAV